MKINAKRFKNGLVNVLLSLVVVAGLSGYGLNVITTLENHTLAQQVVTLEHRSIVSSNRHHASTVAAQNAQKKQQQLIAYGEGVIGTLLNEVIAAQGDGHQTLAEIKAAEDEAKALQTEFNTTIAQASSNLGAGQAALQTQLTNIEGQVNGLAVKVQTLLTEEQKTTTTG